MFRICRAIMSKGILLLNVIIISSFSVLFCLLSASSVAAQDVSYVRIIHAAPSTGAVDVYVDGQPLLTNFAYATLTGYSPLPSGSHIVQIAPTGKGASAAVITQTISLAANTPYSVAAVGTDATKLSLVVFTDDNTIPSTTLAKVRLYHLSPDTGALDIALGPQSQNGLTYQHATVYVMVPPGKYTVNGVMSASNTKVSVGVDVAANYVQSAFFIGLSKGTPKTQFVTARAAALPSLPTTGSDPNAAPIGASTSHALPLWFVMAIVTGMLLVTVTGTAYLRHRTRRTTEV